MFIIYKFYFFGEIYKDSVSGSSSKLVKENANNLTLWLIWNYNFINKFFTVILKFITFYLIYFLSLVI